MAAVVCHPASDCLAARAQQSCVIKRRKTLDAELPFEINFRVNGKVSEGKHDREKGAGRRARGDGFSCRNFQHYALLRDSCVVGGMRADARRARRVWSNRREYADSRRGEKPKCVTGNDITGGAGGGGCGIFFFFSFWGSLGGGRGCSQTHFEERRFHSRR